MSAQPAPADLLNDLAQQAADDAQYYRRILHGLIDQGANLARQVHDQAAAQTEPAKPGDDQPAKPTPDPTIPFDRIARAVRLTVLLARHVAEPIQPRAAQGQNCALDRTAARKRIIREVEDTIQRETKGDRAETLHAELLERLDAPDLDDDILNRPIDDIIVDIRRDFGLGAMPGAHPYKRRTPADIAVLCALAAGPAGSAAPPDPATSSVTPFPRPTPAPTGIGRELPSDPAEAVAMVLRYATPLPDAPLPDE